MGVWAAQARNTAGGKGTPVCPPVTSFVADGAARRLEQHRAGGQAARRQAGGLRHPEIIEASAAGSLRLFVCPYFSI